MNSKNELPEPNDVFIGSSVVWRAISAISPHVR